MKRTMAARSSYCEDRNLLRIRERERRSQDAHQETDFYLKVTPLFGEPYKTNKGDELSSRIQKMLGNYEEVKELIGNNPHQTLFGRLQNLPPPGPYGSRPSRPSHADDTHAPFQNPPQSRPPRPGPAHPPSRPPGAEHGQQPPGYSGSPRDRRPPPPPSPERPREGSQAWPDAEETSSPPLYLPSLSPPTQPLSPLHSSDSSDSEPQEPDDRGTSHPEPQDVPSQANEGPPLPSQTFPPPLPSKPNLVMPQKPTAYVRPLDGQDQAPSESPDLKPSPDDFHGQSYESLPDLKSSNNNKPSLSKLKMPPQPIEVLSNEAHCVEEILREMTHSWPPPLTAIHTPSTAEPSKFSFPSKETQHVHSGFSGQKCYGSSPKVPSSNCQQGSATVQSTNAVSAHSSGGESATSSESESTSGSESDSESGESANAKVPLPPPGSSPPAAKTDDAPTENKWQLHNWIKINQQNSCSDSQADRGQALSPVPQQAHEEEGKASPTKNCKSQTPTLPSKSSTDAVKPVLEGSHGTLGGNKSPQPTDTKRGQRKTVGNKHPSKAAMVPRPEGPKPGLRVESVEVTPRPTDCTFTERPKVKTKPGREKTSSKTHGKKSAKSGSSKESKPKESAPKDESVSVGRSETEPATAPSQVHVRQPPSHASAPHAVRREKSAEKREKSKKKHRARSPTEEKKRRKSKRSEQRRPSTLLVKIKLSLLSRVPPPLAKATHSAGGPQEAAEGKGPETEKEDGGKAASQSCRKREAEKEGQTLPRKWPKLDKEAKPPSSNLSSKKNKLPNGTGKEQEKKKEKKSQPTPKDLAKASGHKQRTAETVEAVKPRDGKQTAKHKKSASKRTDHPKTGKKAPKGGFAVPVPVKPAETSAPSRPLLKFEDRQYPVEYHMKEAKKLKHKADATSDKVGKAFDYLDAAMSFVESGIAMEMDPQTPKSAYTMFSETLELIRFILKLKNTTDPSAPPSDKDFLVLCMRCQSLLQMAMFRYKREAALKYSKTLSEHFKNSRSLRAPSPCVSKSLGTPSPMSPMPSPASSGPGSAHVAGGSGTVVIPQVVQQMAACYVNITALFLGAHDTWEQAEALAQGGSGLLSELDSALGPLGLTSSMSLLVRHTRLGLHWLRQDCSGA